MSRPTIDPAEVRKIATCWRSDPGSVGPSSLDVVFAAAEAWLELEQTAKAFSVVERFHLGTIRRLEEELKRTRVALDHARRTGA